MKKETLETIAQRLDRLEKIVAEMDQKLSSVVEEVATDPSGKGKILQYKTTTKMITSERK